MEPEGSLRHSKVPANCSYPKPAWSSPCPPHPTSWRFILTLYAHLRLVLTRGLFPSVFPTKTLCTPLPSPIRATCPDHLIILDCITQNILGEEYRSLSSSLCIFLHSSVTSSLLGPNILLNTLFSTPSFYVPPSIWATKFHISSHLRLGLTSGPFPSGFSLPKPCIQLYSPPYLLHTTPISFFSIWSPEFVLDVEKNIQLIKKRLAWFEIKWENWNVKRKPNGAKSDVAKGWLYALKWRRMKEERL